MKKLIALTLAVLFALSSLSAFAEVYKDKPTVKAVQQALNDAGYNCGKPDGSAGKKTKAAIESYQADKGLEVTGQIDDALLEALGIAIEEPEAKAEEQVENAEDSALDSSAEETQIDWNNVYAVAELYENTLLDELASRGVDISNETIDGMESYLFSKAFDLTLTSADDKLYLGWWYDEPKFMETSIGLANDVLKEDRFEVNFLESAIIAAVIRMMNAYLDPSEEILAIESEYLSAVPDRDGTVTLNVKDFYLVNSEGHVVVSAETSPDEDRVYLYISGRND